MLAGYLQNGEACITKHACIRWREVAKQEGLRFKQVNFVHDEYQTVVYGPRENAIRMGQIQADAIKWAGEKFNLNCPMAGSFSVGETWYDTH